MSKPSTNTGSTPGGAMAGRKIGVTHPNAVAICIEEPVLDEILEYSEQDLRRELGGFLLGGLVEPDERIVEVRRFWPAVDARSAAASLTFTHETWSQIHRALDKQFPGERIVGWQHTHPGLGVFFSGYDLFIHRNYFREPWQVALVVDPRSQEFSFYQWRQGEIVDCGFFCPKNRLASAERGGETDHHDDRAGGHVTGVSNSAQEQGSD